MSERSTNLPPEQQAIRDKCFHPSGTFVEFPIEDVETSIPERFEKIVYKFPHRLAVKDEGRSLTYDELNRAANRVARAILKEYVDETRPVGVLLTKEATLMVSLLGVLKAGKCFVPLDASFPPTRTATLLEDSQLGLIVTDEENAVSINAISDSNHQVLTVDSIDSDISEDELHVPLMPDSLSFITHTSGSTGRPKGVVQTHRNILYDTMLRANAYRVSDSDRLSLLASNTSSAIKNAFLALLSGASLFPFDANEEGVTVLARWLFEEQITICRISAPLFRKLAESAVGTAGFPYLRLLQFGGDTRYKSDIELCRRFISPNCIISSSFSTGETGYVSEYLIDSHTEIPGKEIPLGYAVENKDILLLDEAGCETDAGTIGELVVSSRYLAAGYWRNPELTEAKFKRDPRDPQKSLYYTGDLGVRLANGCVIHKGRNDFRVKIRGYGVELAEVEKTLREAALTDVVVMARQDATGEAGLVAYCVAATQPPPKISELRRFLKENLPDYMIPSSFVLLDVMPLTPNGKIDRQALPDLGNARPDLEIAFEVPRTSAEAALATIWSDVLGIDRIGIHDDFFDLGGHSLAASRVITRVIQIYQLELPIKALFDSPTVAEMAAVITQYQAKRASEEAFNRMLSEIEAMTEEEAQKQLAGESARSSTEDGHE